LNPYQSSLSLTLRGEEFQLLAERALYWPAKNTLLLADVHLGKEHAFARQGVAIPHGPSLGTLSRLSILLKRLQPAHCIVLGDFFHDTPNRSDSWLQAISEFLDLHPTVTISIVAGNHDRSAGQALIDPRIQWHAQSLLLHPFVLQHIPTQHSRPVFLATTSLYCFASIW